MPGVYIFSINYSIEHTIRLNNLLREAQSGNAAVEHPKKLDLEPSDITFTNCEFSTPRDPIETAEHEIVRRKYVETRNQLIGIVSKYFFHWAYV